MTEPSIDHSIGLDLPDPPQTGDDGVDVALALLAGVLDEPPETRLAVLERVHRTLQDRLADVEE